MGKDDFIKEKIHLGLFLANCWRASTSRSPCWRVNAAYGGEVDGKWTVLQNVNSTKCDHTFPFRFIRLVRKLKRIYMY